MNLSSVTYRCPGSSSQPCPFLSMRQSCRSRTAWRTEAHLHRLPQAGLQQLPHSTTCRFASPLRPRVWGLHTASHRDHHAESLTAYSCFTAEGMSGHNDASCKSSRGHSVAVVWSAGNAAAGDTCSPYWSGGAGPSRSTSDPTAC